jgi:hypothetical protein
MSGVGLRSWQNINFLREFSDVGAFSLSGNREPPGEFSTSSWRVATTTAHEPKPAATWIRRAGGLPSDDYYDEGCAAELRALLREFTPDVVVLETLWMHGYEQVARNYGARVVLDAHNVEADVARQLENREVFGPAKFRRRLFAERVGLLESAVSSRVDQIWVCSLEDRAQFLEIYPVCAPIHLVPNAVDPVRYRTLQLCPPELEGRPGPILLFSGVFHYPPNQRAADFLIQDLFPRLSALYPKASLVLAGANPTPSMLASAQIGCKNRGDGACSGHDSLPATLLCTARAAQRGRGNTL